MKAYGKRIIIRTRSKQEEVTPTGLVLQRVVDNRHDTADVLSVGHEVREAISVGDTVVVERYAGEKIEEDTYAIREGDVIATIT